MDIKPKKGTWLVTDVSLKAFDLAMMTSPPRQQGDGAGRDVAWDVQQAVTAPRHPRGDKEGRQVDLRRFTSDLGWDGPETCPASEKREPETSPRCALSPWAMGTDKGDIGDRWPLSGWFCTSLSPPLPIG